MQATHPNAFALKNSGLDTFLYADVGAELNGSALTILSMIARLGRDPWAEAASWAALPRAGVIESLAENIAQMPLAPSALAETRVTAARLVQLLPATTQSRWQGSAAKAKAPAVPDWVPVTILYSAVVFGMALNALLMPNPPPTVATPVEQSMGVSEATGMATVPLPHDKRVAGPTVAPFGK